LVQPLTHNATAGLSTTSSGEEARMWQTGGVIRSALDWPFRTGRGLLGQSCQVVGLASFSMRFGGGPRVSELRLFTERRKAFASALSVGGRRVLSSRISAFLSGERRAKTWRRVYENNRLFYYYPPMAWGHPTW